MRRILLTPTVDNCYILEKLKKIRDQQGGKHLIIVPDRITLSYERIVYDYLNIPGSFDIEIASFSHLADLVLGDRSSKMFNPQTEVMLMRKILEDNKGELLFYGRAASKPGFAQVMLNLINSMRNNKIKIESIENLLKVFNREDKYKTFLNKTKDILLIYSKYLDFLSDKKVDTISKLEKLCEVFKDSKYVDFNIYISEFVSFTKVELSIIEQFIKNVNIPNVFISLPASSTQNSHLFPKYFVEKLKGFVEDKSEKVLEEIQSTLDPEFEFIRKHLFSYTNISTKIDDSKISITEVANPENEITQLAKKIKYLVKTKSIRYFDIAIVCPDIVGYQDIIKDIFNKYDVPYYMDVKSKLIYQSAIKILLAAFRVVNYNYNQADVIAFVGELKQIFTHEQISQFENYCLKYGIKYENKFNEEFKWGDELERVEPLFVQSKMIEFLSPLKDRKIKPVNEHIDAVKRFLTAIGFDNINEKLTELQEKNDYKVEASITKQTIKKLNEILEQIRTIFNDTKLPFKQFCNILESTIASQEISTIPMYVDCVYVGDCDKSRYERKKYMFVIDAIEGAFPSETWEDGLLSQEECVIWNRIDSENLSIYPDVPQINNNARLNALMILLKPTEGLFISYPLTKQNGEPVFMSPVIRSLQSLLQLPIISAKDQTFSKLKNGATKEDYEKLFISKKSALDELIQINKSIKNNQLVEDIKVRSIKKALYDIAKEEVGEQFLDSVLEQANSNVDYVQYKDFEVLKDNKISSSRLESYFRCPFSFFADKVLSIREREEAGVKALDKGSIVHAIVEEFFKNHYRKTPENKINDVVVSTLDDVIKNHKEYAYFNEEEYKIQKASIIKLTTKGIKILVEKMKSTLFVPTQFECSFSNKDGDYPALEFEYDGEKIIVDGKIDRVDMYEDKFIVIDYKNKNKIEFTDTSFKRGNTIQPFIYVDAITKATNKKPVGNYYLLLNDEMITETSKKNHLKYIGFTIEDVDIMKELDVNLKETTESNLYPISLNKQGEIKKSTTRQSYEKDIEYLEKLIGNAVKEIKSGYIAPSPAEKNACKYCAFRGFCNHQERTDLMRG